MDELLFKKLHTFEAAQSVSTICETQNILEEVSDYDPIRW